MKKPTNLIFIGTPEFGALILNKLIQNHYKPSLVITVPDKPVGRKQILTPSAVKVVAQKHNITLAQPEKIQDIKDKIKNTLPDLIIIASYGQIIPKDILDLAKHGCLNVHPSLLPQHRGASPIQTAILNGDQNTGVTIMLMDEKMDHGPIITQEELNQPISNLTYIELHDRLAHLGAELLIDTIPKWLNQEIVAKAQDETKATYTKLFKKEDGKIDWHQPAETILRQIKAFYPWPGTYTNFNNQNQTKRVNILAAEAIEPSHATTFPVGKILIVNDKLAVQCKSGLLIIHKLQMEGGRIMLSQDFLKGNKNYVSAQ